MKRKITAVIIGALTAAALSVPALAAPQISIYINGTQIQTDTAPQITPEGRTLVPLRVISESLGAEVDWSQEEKKVITVKNGRILELTIGSKTIFNDGEAVEIDSPAQIVNGRTMVPVRVISESYGCDVTWDGETKTVYITAIPDEDEFSDFGGEVVSLPAYHYTGSTAYMDTICQYLISYTSGNYDPASVTIPVPLIVEMNDSDPNDIKVWGAFEVSNYNLSGDVLQCVSGGNYPGCMHLKKQGSEYSVTKFDVAQDGEGNAASLRKICLGDETRFQKISKVSERRDAERKNIISDYVKSNKLKINAYQDYGWDAVQIGSTPPTSAVPTEPTDSGDGTIGASVFEDNLPGYFEFSSGAGAWSTNLFLSQDGTFTGFYHDSNMGETGSGYSDGTVYECSFSGSFTNVSKNGNYYNMTLSGVQTEKPEGEEEIADNMRHVAAQPYGLESGTDFVLYLPDTPLSSLSEDFLTWWPGRFDESGTHTNLDCYGILNKATGYGFFGYSYDNVEPVEGTDTSVTESTDTVVPADTDDHGGNSYSY